ncbi:sec-independent protein translocase protein TatB [Devosia sp. UYZn731]|uniref:Sec-independent protein translocase protein TatB n=1 Tax=Devosia sp. UYZn731 TaxID=3156345 RepID=UPI003390E45E
MLGLGWTEMLVIGVAALIFIGPKDLPVVMKRLGQLTGQIRRMGNEFQREINKTTGLDEVRNLRNAITQPLKQTTDQIRKDFNAMTATGEVKPSGLIKPADPKVESVVDEIHAAAGITPPVMTPLKEVEAVKPVAKKAPVKAAVVAKKPAAKKAPAKAKPAPTSPVTTTELKILEAVPAPAESQPVDIKPVARKRTPKVASGNTVPVLPTEPADSPAAPTPRARAPRKPKTPQAKAGTE